MHVRNVKYLGKPPTSDEARQKRFAGVLEEGFDAHEAMQIVACFLEGAGKAARTLRAARETVHKVRTPVFPAEAQTRIAAVKDHVSAASTAAAMRVRGVRALYAVLFNRLCGLDPLTDLAAFLDAPARVEDAASALPTGEHYPASDSDSEAETEPEVGDNVFVEAPEELDDGQDVPFLPFDEDPGSDEDLA